ncbi:hypothetical protein Lalb_Chr10g0095521 [Lupinus albus]|uniref:Uncharacterized protein n=1 Tax=Lupinus albus TaxID=3870 RepID=A0A6A4PUW5_LUPAL|nr:hypothetical protein Lalb_Chr10g0095521 [Lupinus albus]
MEFWELFIISLMPVLKVLLITAIGTILALDRFDILGDKATKHMNTVSLNILISFSLNPKF